MAHYTGVLSVDSLFDYLEAQPPSRAELKKAAMKDDCASARLFMRSVDAFILHVLGIDPVTKIGLEQGGLFGKTRAYFGMVETQGRGTLHIHFFIWIHGVPHNSVDFEKKLHAHGEDFKARVSAYADSIVTNRFPIHSPTQCSRCNTTNSLQALPIPPAARKQARSVHRSQQRKLEPLLVSCTVCGQKASSQHIIRQLLLNNRPPHWPPPVRPFEGDELRVELEVKSRLSLSQAQNIVRDREMFFSANVKTQDDEVAESTLRGHDGPQLAYLHPDDDPYCNDPLTRLIQLTPPFADTARVSSTTRAYMLASLVQDLNMHWWGHAGSCFKKSRATSDSQCCRYGFPRQRFSETQVTENVLSLRRGLGHEYINGYNPTIMAAFKCNHDIQVLFGGKGATNRIYYCCKYVTKPQKLIDCTSAVALASFQRRLNREITEEASTQPPSLQDVQRRRVTGMVYTFTNKQEIAGPLAALYILRGSCCYSSASCTKIPLSDIIIQLESREAYNCSLVRVESSNGAGSYKSASFLDDYMHRPDSVDDQSVYEYAMRCYRRLRGRTISSQHIFKGPHPLRASHCIAFRKREAVPVIHGPRLPLVNENVEPAVKELYAKISLILFKPFRSSSDLVRNGSWATAYGEWGKKRTEFTRTIMANMEDYYLGRAKQDDAVLSGEVDEHDLDHSSDCAQSDDDAYLSEDMSDISDGSDVGHTTDNFIGNVLNSIPEGDLHTFPTPAGFNSRIQTILNQFEENQMMEGIARKVTRGRVAIETSAFEANPLSLSPGELRKWVRDQATDSTVSRASSENEHIDVREIPTTVTEIIDEALLPDQLKWVPITVSSGQRQLLPDYAKIGAVSQPFTLNELQHDAFVMASTRLLRRWRRSIESVSATIVSDEVLAAEQLLMYMGGEGGTGKSRVIGAIQELCRSWRRPSSIVLTALTGKAASIINGRTVASFQMALRGASRSELLQDVDCIVVDEVSMMSKTQLLRLDRLLRKTKKIENVPFGGLHVVLVGDFLQLPPVGADPIYLDPSAKPAATASDIEGFHLWRKFDKVVVLRESVRFRSDPSWGNGCSQARNGVWTSDFKDRINQRVLNGSNDSNIMCHESTVFVTADNDTRTAINDYFVATAAKHLGSGKYPIRVVANFKGALNKLSREDVNTIMGTSDSKFGRMAPYLDLIPGMPIQVTQNLRTQKGVANGTLGTLHSVKFPPGTVFRRVQDVRTGVVVNLPDKRPTHAFHLNRGTNAVSIADGVDSALFPVFPDAEAFQKSSIRLTPSFDGQSRSLTLKIQQFPFVCAVGATIYKVQGESLQSLAVVDWKTTVRAANKPQQAYLMVSRAVRGAGLVSMKPFTDAIATWSKPPSCVCHVGFQLGNGGCHSVICRLPNKTCSSVPTLSLLNNKAVLKV